MRVLILRGITLYGGNPDDSAETGDGPTTGGEPTSVYKWTYEDAGRPLISSSERSLGDSPSERQALARTKEIFSNLTGTTELTVGKNSGRVYSIVVTRDGPKLSDRTETVFDQYDQPVDIQPPPNVPAPAEDESASNCPEPPTDFPWIPAAVASVLGPLLFLAGSSFLWPRRL